MKFKSSRVTEVKIQFSESEARWLMGLIQNNTIYEIGEEPPEEYKYRQDLFEGLREALGISSIPSAYSGENL